MTAKKIITQKPQINLSYSTAGRMWLVFGCAFLCVFQSSLTDGGLSLIIVLTSFFTALLVELLLTWKKSGFSKIKDGSAAAIAMTLSLLLPNMIHPVYAAFGAAFAVAVVKYSFGGLGSNWLNPALGGWLFIRFSWPPLFSDALASSPSVTEMAIVSNTSALDNSVSSFLNGTFFSFTDAYLPSGYIDLLFNNNPGLITDRGLFALLVGTVIITAFGINRSWVSLVFLAIYGLLIRFAGGLAQGFWSGDMLYGFFSGGTMVAAFILAAESASGAKYKQGIILMATLGAVLSWIFRYLCFEYTGCFIALAIVNCLTPMIRFLEEKFFFLRKKSALSEGRP
ncbi:MAG: RnfABCDGE type electron transport complex subunit D [Treponema sp.]|jgi:electron transport complex protein RnfD|nr:RnfABCDGE type electron transport complex subunit D [Treponema sp.]